VTDCRDDVRQDFFSPSEERIKVRGTGRSRAAQPNTVNQFNFLVWHLGS